VKIAVIHTRYRQQGGEEVAFEAEARLLAEHGHDVCRIEADNAELEAVPPPTAAALAVWNEKRRQDIAERLRSFKPDVVHFHNTFPLLSPAVYYAIPRRVATVQTLHNYRLVCPAATLLRDSGVCEDCVGRAPLPAVRYGCYRGSRAASAAAAIMLQVHRVLRTWQEQVDAFIALTSFAKGIFVRGGLPAERVFVKPNFVDPDPGAGAHDQDHFLFVGRLHEQKGIPLLLEAFSQTGLSLRIAGAGPLEADVRAAAAALPTITFLGSQPRARVIDEMKTARALVVPSVSYENFPLVLAEAFATGLPVIVSDLPNLGELVVRAGAGWSFRNANASDLARVLRQVNQDAEGRRVASGSARSLYQAEYTGAATHATLEMVYRAARRRVEVRFA